MRDQAKEKKTSTLATLNLCSLSTAKKFPFEAKAHLYKLEIPFGETKDKNSIYYTKTLPEGKLYYPEPFIASHFFSHEEIWFIHILHHNH